MQHELFCYGCRRKNYDNASLRDEPFIACSKCGRDYHRKCAGPTAVRGTRSRNPWICASCEVAQPRKDNTEIPIKGAEPLDDLDTGSDATADNASSSNESSANVALPEMPPSRQEIAEFYEDVKLFRSEFKMMREEIMDYKRFRVESSSRLDDVLSKINEMGQRLCILEQREPDVKTMQQTIQNMEGQLNEREQESMANVIEIYGLSELPGENLGHLITVVGQKIGVTLDERDVDYVTRVGGRRSSAPAAGVPGASDAGDRPRPVVLKLTRRKVKDELLKAARVRRGLSTADIGLQGFDRKVFLNERLSKANRELFYNARAKAKEHSYKYVWTQGGQVLARRAAGHAALRIRSKADLNLFLKPASQPQA